MWKVLICVYFAGRKVKVKRPGLVVSPVKPPSPPSATIPPKTAFKPVNIPPPPVKKQQEPPKFAKQNPKNKFAQCPELLRQPIRFVESLYLFI